MSKLARVFLFGWLLLGTLVWGDPSGFFAEEIVRAKEIHPGVTWYTVKGLWEGERMEAHLLHVDKSKANVVLQSVVGGAHSRTGSDRQYFLRSTPSRFLQDHGLLAAINASFFDIRGTQSPTGLLIRDGVLLRNPLVIRPSLLILEDNSLRLSNTGWEGKVVYKGEETPLVAVNQPGFPSGGVGLYLPPWSRTPDPQAQFLGGHAVQEIVLRRTEAEEASDEEWVTFSGVVVEKLAGEPSRELKADEWVLLMEAGHKLGTALQPGDPVSVRWRLTDLPEGVRSGQIRDAVAGRPILIKDGVFQQGKGSFWTTRHPRSAIGWTEQGKQMWWVLVDGRSRHSVGMDLDTLAKYFMHLQVTEAMNLDGGGSSSLAIHLNDDVRVVNSPSDLIERFVPTALGLRIE